MYKLNSHRLNSLQYSEVVFWFFFFFTSKIENIYVEESRYAWEQATSINKTKEIREDLA